MITKMPLVCAYCIGDIYNFIFVVSNKDDLMNIMSGDMFNVIKSEDINYVPNENIEDILKILNIDITSDDFVDIFQSDILVEITENTKIVLASVKITNVENLSPTLYDEDDFDYMDTLISNNGDSKKNIHYKTYNVKIFKKGKDNSYIYDDIVKPFNDAVKFNNIKNMSCFFCNQTRKKEYYENTLYSIIGDITTYIKELGMANPECLEKTPKKYTLDEACDLIDIIEANVLNNFNKNLCPTFDIDDKYISSVKYDDFLMDLKKFFTEENQNDVIIYIITLVLFSDMLIFYLFSINNPMVTGIPINDNSYSFCYPSWLPKMKTCNISIDTLTKLSDALKNEVDDIKNEF